MVVVGGKDFHFLSLGQEYIYKCKHQHWVISTVNMCTEFLSVNSRYCIFMCSKKVHYIKCVSTQERGVCVRIISTYLDTRHIHWLTYDTHTPQSASLWDRN